MKKLKWGQTPWDNLTKEELLREVQRMFSALQSAQSVMRLCEMNGGGSTFWGPQGTGGTGIEKARQVLDPIFEKYDSENIYRAFFRTADDLLFEQGRARIGFGWAVCDKCGCMVGARMLEDLSYGPPPIGEKCLNKNCEGNPMRELRWSDLDPKKAE
jgi:hypothetical protein